MFYPNHIHVCLAELNSEDSLGYVFTRMKIDMHMHSDWLPSLDEGYPINFCVRRVWRDMIQGSGEDDDFCTYRTEDALCRACLRRLVEHRKLESETCEQFVSPGNALDRQRRKFSYSMAEWSRRGIDDGFRLTPKMEAVAGARFAHVARLRGEQI